MKKLVHMRHHLARHKHWYALAGLLMFASGCSGAVSQTGNELGKDIAAPIVVPIEQGQNAKAKLNAINQQQVDKNQQLDDIK